MCGHGTWTWQEKTQAQGNCWALALSFIEAIPNCKTKIASKLAYTEIEDSGPSLATGQDQKPEQAPAPPLPPPHKIVIPEATVPSTDSELEKMGSCLNTVF